jgi:hypothetical protein
MGEAVRPGREAHRAAGRRARPTRDSGVERLVVPTPAGDLVIPVAEIDWIGADDYYASPARGREGLSAARIALVARGAAGCAPLRPRSQVGNRTTRSRARRSRTAPEGGEVVLRNGSRIPVSRRKRGVLQDRLRYRID